MTVSTFNILVQLACITYNASVSSTHRTIDHNRTVGGASHSQHLGWKAADLVLTDNTRAQALVDACKALGLFAIDETARKNHVHIDDRFNANL
jgi:uncharacterized protein YcbK (DUF882 family)